jgi:peptidoglycan hydrolase-like protein with peptidoglycan-binding domain
VSVFHVQRRLYELGYQDSASDKRGFFGDNTKNALAYFQSANSLEASGLPNRETLSLLFSGDENVFLTLD